MALIFDSLTTDRVLQSTGFSVQQAEGIAEQMNQFLIQDIATMGDIDAVRGEMAAMRIELKGDIKALRTELKGDMTSLTSELTVKMYTVGLAVVALVVAAQKLLP